MNYKITSVPLALIDSENDTFHITTATHCEDIERSVKSVGLIHPPLLIASDSKFTIVSGFRRIKACGIIGEASIEAAVFKAGLDDLQFAKLAIADNLSQRELNWVEISRGLHLLLRCLNDSHALPDVAAELGLPCDNPAIIEKVKKIKNMPPDIQEGVISGRISLPMALELGEMDIESGSLLSNIFQTLNLSLNKQREVLSLAREVSLRDNAPILSVLAETGVNVELRHKDLDRGEIIRQLRTNLREKRFPFLTRHEALFHDYIKSLKLPRYAKIMPPKDFEGNTYTAQFQFKNLDELTACRKTMDTIILHPATKSIIE